MFQEIKNRNIEDAIREIMDQYSSKTDNYRPWIIGFSGGKDSTVLLTLVWIALRRLQEDFPIANRLKRKVYVVTNDTMVENPIIEGYVGDVHDKIEAAARDQGLPIHVQKTTPRLDESFWTNIIGKGYPVPNNTFRWCTDKLKIRPTSDFLDFITKEKGEAIILIGTRYQESATRERSIKKHEVKGKRLSKHSVSSNAYVYAPIKSLMLEEIWYIIRAIPSPWGFDNDILFKIYADASADDYECPTVVTDDKHTSCGQSRFGCWTCTVVKKDKSMSSLIKNGQEWMKPLMEFRDKLIQNRNLHENRLSTRRNGERAVDKDGNNQGNYSPKYRAEILEELLILQKEIQKIKPHITLITNQELIAIQVIWNREKELISQWKVGDIYKRVYHKNISTNNINSLDNTERRILKEVCNDDLNYYPLIENLISLQESKALMLSKYGMHNDVEKRIESFIKNEQ
ncbi:DNA phosphorothioation system sulfurtransferase DndC [uncultured Draconibacterium sp.]|uniref:DNA phosphorothioation system sulfurtransferase DndC n=1 Tax=uncultured Draconibacterium sp. TaxID=1573823 RepID=UPI002AA65DE8|nr:DNA phosphorothioation system sulfurtransferase DndC [uncultured Draconibacterium sp.]